jgi:hypothetical protein
MTPEKKTGEVDASNKDSDLSEKGQRKIESYRDQFGDDFDPFEATDNDNNSFDPEKHRTHKETNVPVLSAKGNLYRKKGKGGGSSSSSGSSGSKKTEASTGAKSSTLSGGKGEEELEKGRARIKAEEMVDRLIGMLDTEEHQTEERERRHLVNIQTEFNRKFGIVAFPFLVDYPISWGVWLKPRIVGGPGGWDGLVEMYMTAYEYVFGSSDDEEQGPLARVSGDKIEPEDPDEEDFQGGGMPESFSSNE